MKNVFLITALCGASALAGVQYAKPQAAPAPTLTPVVKQSLTAAPQAPCLTKGCTCGENCACTAMGECLNKEESTSQEPATGTVASPAAPQPTAGGVSYTAAPGYRLVCPTDGSPCYQVPIQPTSQYAQPVYRQPVYYRTVPVYRRGRQVGWQRVYSRTYYQACRPGGG